jgi:hypothetical protein
VVGVPKLGGDEEFFTSNTTILDGLTNLLLVTI